MKTVTSFFLVAALFLGYATAYPGMRRESEESDEYPGPDHDGIVLVLPNHRSIFEDMLNREREERPKVPSFWGSQSSSSFDSMFSKMQEIMKRLTANLEAAMQGQFNQTGPVWGKVPEGANSTSRTKVVGNHTVTINETTHSQNDENGSSVFHWQIVQVRPINDTDTIMPGSEDDDDIIKESTESMNTNNSKDDNMNKSNEEPNKENEEIEKSTSPNVDPVPPQTEANNNEDSLNEIPKSQVEILRA